MLKSEVSARALSHAHTHTLSVMKWKNVEETLRGAEEPLFWVGAFTVASLAFWLVYRLLSGFRIWVLGNGKLLSPKLGKWAGESGHVNVCG